MDSVAGGFAEGAAVIVAALELVGVGVDGDEFVVAPGAGGVLVGGHLAVGLVAHRDELAGNVVGEGAFEIEAVGEVLVVEARGVGGLLDVEAVVEGADEVVGHRGDDGRATGGAEDEADAAAMEEGAAGEDDGGGHGGERSLAGGDGVGGTLDEAVHVGDALLGGEVVHLVVHEEAEGTDGHA